LPESGEEDEAAERGAGGVEHELLHEAGGRLRRPHPRGGGVEEGISPVAVEKVDWIELDLEKGLGFLSLGLALVDSLCTVLALGPFFQSEN
jgi:hypothetical protein